MKGIIIFLAIFFIFAFRSPLTPIIYAASPDGVSCNDDIDCNSGSCNEYKISGAGRTPIAPTVKRCGPPGDKGANKVVIPIQEKLDKETALLNSPCKQKGDGENAYFECDTGLGITISSNPKDFVRILFGVILSISGGIALLLIIFSGYRLMASRGNSEKITEAKDRLTSAVIGLLFIIFSLVILQIIGVDILHIPGLSP